MIRLQRTLHRKILHCGSRTASKEGRILLCPLKTRARAPEHTAHFPPLASPLLNVQLDCDGASPLLLRRYSRTTSCEYMQFASACHDACVTTKMLQRRLYGPILTVSLWMCCQVERRRILVPSPHSGRTSNQGVRLAVLARGFGHLAR